MSKINDNGINKLAEVRKGHTVAMDNGRHAVLGCCDWSEADYRLCGDWAGGLKGHAVRIEVTGQKVRYESHGFTGGSIRVKVTFPGDGEADISVGGWVSANEALRGSGNINPMVWCHCNEG